MTQRSLEEQIAYERKLLRLTRCQWKWVNGEKRGRRCTSRAVHFDILRDNQDELWAYCEEHVHVGARMSSLFAPPRLRIETLTKMRLPELAGSEQ